MVSYLENFAELFDTFEPHAAPLGLAFAGTNKSREFDLFDFKPLCLLRSSKKSFLSGLDPRNVQLFLYHFMLLTINMRILKETFLSKIYHKESSKNYLL